MNIREATPEDNQQLIQLQQKCPMGSDLLLQLNGSPDFFNRSRGYQDWTILVAEENHQIIGSAGLAVQDKVIDGSLYNGVYEYDFMVDPEHRRRGIATLLQNAIEERAQGDGVDFLYLNITEDNVASHTFFTRHGFKPVRQCSPLMFMAYKKHETDHYKIRPMKENDMRARPFTDKSFTEHFNHLPFYSTQDIYLYEHDTVKAVAGYWDYTKVMRFTLQSYNTRWKIMAAVAGVLGMITTMPKVPKVGEPMTNWYLTPFAYRDPDAGNQLLMHILNMAHLNGIYIVGLPVDKESPGYTDHDKLKPNKGSFTFYVKPFRDLPEINQIYIDPLDI